MSYEEKKQILESITAYLGGVATEEELLHIEEWRNESPSNEAFWERITTKGLTEKKLAEFRENDVETAWALMEKRMGKGERKRIWSRSFVRYAAVVAGIAFAGMIYQLINSQTDTKYAKAPETPVAGIELVLSDGTVVPIDREDNQVIREKTGAISDKESKHLDFSASVQHQDTVMEYNEIRMQNSMEYRMTLADGTRVFLNAESRMRFPLKFLGKKRVIEFEGEAYFDVARNTESPFVIKTGELEITVLGTEFNLRAYQDETSIETTLVEGSVEVSRGTQLCRIVPGEQAVFERSSGELTSRMVDVSLYTAWHRSEIMFKDTRLEDVMRNLARWYGISYHFLDESAKDIEFGGCFDRYASIEPILSMLRRTELVSVVKENKDVYISLKK